MTNNFLNYKETEALSSMKNISYLFIDDEFYKLQDKLMSLGFDFSSNDNYKIKLFLKLYNHHNSKILLNNQTIIVDRELEQHIIELNRKGYKTLYSCSGHLINRCYIMIDGIYNLKFDNFSIEHDYDKNTTTIRGRSPKGSLDGMNILLNLYNEICKL